MAAVEVSTWPQLKTELQAAHDVKLMADIDMNEVAPNGDYITLSYGESVTLDGNHHVIKNLRTPVSSPRPIFACQFGGVNRHLVIKDLDFQNLILAGASLVGANTGYSYAPSTTQINGCRFVGSRSGAAYLLAYTGGITLNNCYFNLPWKGTGSNLAYTSLIPKTLSESPNITDSANYCRFDESYGGWDVPTNIYYNNTDSAFLGCSYFKLSGCRIEGNVKLPYGNSTYFPYIHNNFVNRYTPSAQNVCDLDWTGGYVSNYNTYRYNNFSGVMKKSFKKNDGTGVTTPYDGTASGYPIPILATEAQMKDASWLSSHGFDIIIPE